MHTKDIGCKMELCIPEHPHSNGIDEKMMASLTKITNAPIGERKEPPAIFQNILMSYRYIIYPSTISSPCQLLMRKNIRTTVPIKNDIKVQPVPQNVFKYDAEV